MKKRPIKPYHGQWLYLGCDRHALTAVVMPAAIGLMWVFAGWLLSERASLGGIMMAVTALTGSGITAAYWWTVRDRLYSWGAFDENEVIIRSLFRGTCALQYDDIGQVGIRVYVYGDPYNEKSKRIFWIFLTEDRLKRAYARNMNRLPNRAWSVKLPFRPDLYHYLTAVLPEEKANMLRISRIKMLKHPEHNQYMINK